MIIMVTLCILLHNVITCEVHTIYKSTINQFIQYDLENEESG